MNKKIILIIIAILVTWAGLAGLVWLKNKKFDARVDVYVLPTDAKLLIDGKGAKKGVSKLQSGKHTLTARRSGFADKSIDFVLAKGETKNVQVGLDPNSQEGYKWLADHPEQIQEAQGVTGKNYSQIVDNTVSDNPLVKYLPHVDLHYRIDYGKSVAHPSDPHAVAIVITTDSTPSAKDDALDWIQFKGSDPAKLELIYKNF